MDNAVAHYTEFLSDFKTKGCGKAYDGAKVCCGKAVTGTEPECASVQKLQEINTDFRERLDLFGKEVADKFKPFKM